MKNLFLFLIEVYGKILSPILKNILGAKGFCRFKLTCSEFTKLSIQKHGVYRGIYLSVKRLFMCQPFYRV